MVVGRLHVGDGGHRLALLLRRDEVLRPKEYLVDPRPQKAILDNTAILAPALSLPESTYARFLSPGFTDEVFDTVAALHRNVADVHPERLGELEQLLDVHGRRADLSV